MQLDPELQAMLDERKRTMAEFSADHRPMTIYAIYRNDIYMDKHKLGAQLGHAFDLCAVAAKESDPELLSRYRGTGNGKKTVMRASDLNKLQRGWREARAAGLPCFVVIDRSHVYPPDFDGEPIITAIGIGPVYEDVARDITKRFTMICPTENAPAPKAKADAATA